MKMKKNKLRVLVVCGILMAYSLCACASNNASADSQKSTSSVSHDEVTTNENNTTDMKKKTLHPSGFTSKWRAYSSTTTPPTEPGRYTMTVVVLGGNYLASPINRSFQITK